MRFTPETRTLIERLTESRHVPYMFSTLRLRVSNETAPLSPPTRSHMSRTLLIAYDLAQASASRPQIADTLMSIGEAWARPLDTVWMLRTSLPAETVEARLAPLLGADEGLMVQEARGEAALANTSLRWFRPRRQAALAALETAAVLAFRDNRSDVEVDLVQAA